MPSFDITSKANFENIKNAVDVSMKMIINRYDFKGTSAKVALNESEMKIEISADSEFQLDQIKASQQVFNQAFVEASKEVAEEVLKEKE